MYLVLADDFASYLEKGGPPGGADILRQLARGVYAELEHGAGIEQTLQVVTGRKPSLAEQVL